jgi:diguanylate cyclase (GGDEF)-like protein
LSAAPPAGPHREADLEQEARELRARIAELKAEAARNEQLFRKTLSRELELLRAEALPELLGTVVRGLKASYSLEAVTVAVQDPQHEIRHLLLGDGHRPDEFEGVLFTDGVTGLAPQARSLARPWLGPYIQPDHQLLFPGTGSLGSVALIPLVRGDRLVGILSFGSADSRRFTRHHATDFLTHLGAIVAFCLENAVNRARLVRAGLTDFLTGWHNKRYLHNRLREELARAARLEQSVSLLMMDLDRFKEINETCGHLGGDEVIREVASRIESQIRASDAAARFGGDEFVVLLPGTAAGAAVHIAERIRQSVSGSPLEPGPGQRLTVTLSIGIASLAPTRGDADLKALAERLLAEADAALYRAKAAGRDQLAVHP